MKMRIILYLILFLSASLMAQENYIREVKIVSTTNEIVINIHLNDFFKEDILDAIKSGMNIAFHFYTELHDQNNQMIKDQENRIFVRNDVWENMFLIKGYKLSKRVKKLAQLKSFLMDSISIRLKSTSNIPENKQLKLIVSFSPQKISTSQKKKLREWLSNEEVEAESSFSLNLSKLISFFVSTEKKENLSVFKSAIFTKKSVSINVRTSQ